MRVLIVSVNRNRNPFPVVPAGACMVSEAAHRAGHETAMFDFMFERNPLKRLAEKIAGFKPDVIGLSIRNIDNNDIQNPLFFLDDLPEVLNVARRTSGAVVVLGGPAIGIMPFEILRHAGADFALRGDAGAFVQLLAQMADGGSLDAVPGLAWLDGERNAESGARHDTTADFLSPDYRRWIPVDRYQKNLATVPLKTKTGCGFRCSYCTYGMIEGIEYHLHRPEEVATTCRELAESGMKDIEFVDNVFNYPYDHAFEVCEAIGRKGVRARFQTLELNPAYLDRPLLGVMERVGFRGIGVTVESASDTVLRRMRKGYGRDDIDRCADAVRRHAIPCIWFYMLGGPGETETTARETLAFIRATLRPGDLAYVTVGIRVYPGTPLEVTAREEGVLTVQREEMLEPRFYLSPGVEREWLLEQLKTISRDRTNVMVAGEMGSPLMPLLCRVGYRLGVRPPVWRHTGHIKRTMQLIGMGS